MRLNVVMLGPTGSGKSLLRHGLSQPREELSSDYAPTFGVSVGFLHHENTTVILNDPSGDSRFSTMRKSFIERSDHFIIVVDSDSSTLTTDIENCFGEIEAVKPSESYKTLLIINDTKESKHHMDKIFSISDPTFKKIPYITVGRILPDPNDPFICSVRKMIMHRFAQSKNYDGQVSKIRANSIPTSTTSSTFFSSSYARLTNYLSSFNSNNTSVQSRTDPNESLLKQ